MLAFVEMKMIVCNCVCIVYVVQKHRYNADSETQFGVDSFAIFTWSCK